MSIMGGVFTSIMGGWKLSAPLTINSNKAYYLAETAAMFALQDAKHRFFSTKTDGTPIFPHETTGIRTDPYIVSDSGTETAEYWIERPYFAGTSPYSTNSTVDLNRGNNDDIITGTNDDEDVDDDDDDDTTVDGTTDVNSDGFSDVYTIIATGKIKRGTATIAKRQIKIKATITDNNAAPVDSGIHVEGSLEGSGSGAFKIWQDGQTVATDTPVVTFSNGTYATSNDAPYSGSRAGVVYQPPADSDPPDLDEEFFKAIAADQAHTNPSPPNNSTYPVGSSSFYYDAPTNTIPNVTYINGDLITNNVTLYGVYYVTGLVRMQGNMHVEGIIIGNSTIKLSASSAASDPHLEGGIIQFGGTGHIWGAGNPSTIQINDAFFDALNNTIPDIRIQSFQEAMSAN
ncbi:MAG: hypothetical protein GY781_09625 [Gammaproteobacteria bacterium]|nr:hypothetical protein [Gammaproteobacteria bacterium]